MIFNYANIIVILSICKSLTFDLELLTTKKETQVNESLFLFL
jgi:hypothetical protein